MSEQQNEMTVAEMADSLTGFEEIAVEQHMGFNVYDESNGGTAGGGVRFLRALIFVDKTRAGLVAPEAKKTALELTGGVVAKYFAPDEPEIDEDAPETPSGEDSAPVD